MVFSRFENRDPSLDNKISLLNNLVLNLKTQLREVSDSAKIEKEGLIEKIESERARSHRESLRADELDKQLTDAWKVFREQEKALADKRAECDDLRKEANDADNALTTMCSTIQQQQEEIKQLKTASEFLQSKSAESERVKIELQNTKNDLEVKTSQLQKAERELVAFKMARLDRTAQMNSYVSLLKSSEECDVLLWHFIENNFLALAEKGVNQYISVTGRSNARWIGIIEKCKQFPDYDKAVFGRNVLKFVICYRDQRMAFLDLIDSFIKTENAPTQRVIADSVKMQMQSFITNVSKMTYLLNELGEKIRLGTVPSRIDATFRCEIDELQQRGTVS